MSPWWGALRSFCFTVCQKKMSPVVDHHDGSWRQCCVCVAASTTVDDGCCCVAAADVPTDGDWMFWLRSILTKKSTTNNKQLLWSSLHQQLRWSTLRQSFQPPITADVKLFLTLSVPVSRRNTSYWCQLLTFHTFFNEHYLSNCYDVHVPGVSIRYMLCDHYVSNSWGTTFNDVTLHRCPTTQMFYHRGLLTADADVPDSQWIQER